MESQFFSEVFNNKINVLFQNESIKINKQDLAIPNQTHSSNVQFVTKPGIYDNTDGLITSKDYNLKLSTKVADCVPIYLYDSKNNLYYAKQEKSNIVYVLEAKSKKLKKEIKLDYKTPKVMHHDVASHFIAFTGKVGEELILLDVDKKFNKYEIIGIDVPAQQLDFVLQPTR